MRASRPIRASCGGGDARPSTHLELSNEWQQAGASSPEVSIKSKPKPPSAYSPTTSCEQSIWLAPRVSGPVSPEPHKKEAKVAGASRFHTACLRAGLRIRGLGTVTVALRQLGAALLWLTKGRSVACRDIRQNENPAQSPS